MRRLTVIPRAVAQAVMAAWDLAFDALAVVAVAYASRLDKAWQAER